MQDPKTQTKERQRQRRESRRWSNYVHYRRYHIIFRRMTSKPAAAANTNNTDSCSIRLINHDDNDDDEPSSLSPFMQKQDDNPPLTKDTYPATSRIEHGNALDVADCVNKGMKQRQSSDTYYDDKNDDINGDSNSASNSNSNSNIGNRRKEHKGVRISYVGKYLFKKARVKRLRGKEQRNKGNKMKNSNRDYTETKENNNDDDHDKYKAGRNDGESECDNDDDDDDNDNDNDDDDDDDDDDRYEKLKYGFDSHNEIFSENNNDLESMSKTLVVIRTPSLNVMLHANESYSESNTLLKRSSIRISWDDLEEKSNIITNNTNTNTNQTNNSRNYGSSRFSYCNEDFEKFVLNEKIKDWLKSFKRCDPRYRILKFFDDVANEGATGESQNFVRTPVNPFKTKMFYRSSVFTVWRPTSKDAIKRMMLGEGVGKGLDIKGKSAKRGKLSGLVPFLQINQEEHKKKVRTLRKNSKIRIFFNTSKDRDYVVNNLNNLARELQQTVRESKHIVTVADNIDNNNNNNDNTTTTNTTDTNINTLYDEKTIENAMEKLILDMDDPIIDLIDTYSPSKYGMAVQERLFWEGMVVRQRISRKIGSDDDTGRTSIPSFQDMNFTSLRSPSAGISGGTTRSVIIQYRPLDEEDGTYDPMSPLNLVMAYEENHPKIERFRVIPCVSDFDCFIVGSRGVKYEEQVPEEQLDILKWGVTQTEKILEKENSDSWTQRWLDVLKECSSKGFKPNIPPGGYSDPKTRLIFRHAIKRLSITGCVRHGAECFNYYFPQELDEKLLVISDELPEQYNGRRCVYVDQDELKEILKKKIQHGYTFPLNPKWILCDPGWREVYDQLMASTKPDVQQSLQCWYPPESGIRELIENVSTKYPDGFHRLEDINESNNGRRQSTRLSYVDGTAAMDLAEQRLKYYLIFQRARSRLKAILIIKHILDKIREERNLKEDNDSQPSTSESEPSALDLLENMRSVMVSESKKSGDKDQKVSELESESKRLTEQITSKEIECEKTRGDLLSKGKQFDHLRAAVLEAAKSGTGTANVSVSSTAEPAQREDM